MWDKFQFIILCLTLVLFPSGGGGDHPALFRNLFLSLVRENASCGKTLLFLCVKNCCRSLSLSVAIARQPRPWLAGPGTLLRELCVISEWLWWAWENKGAPRRPHSEESRERVTGWEGLPARDLRSRLFLFSYHILVRVSGERPGEWLLRGGTCWESSFAVERERARAWHAQVAHVVRGGCRSRLY